MLIFKETDQLLKYLENYLKENSISIISIDGKNGSGKSTLAKNISNRKGYVHINLDSDRYLEKNKGRYVNFIKYDILQKDIKKILENGERIIIEGICLLKILDVIGIKPDLKIYVKRMSSDGHHWYDGNLFDYSRSPEEIIKEEDEDLKKFMQISARIEGEDIDPFPIKESIFHEIIRYHFEYRPDLNSDIIFERSEN